MSDIISVIEDLLEATDNSVNKKNLTTDGKTADSKTVKPAAGNTSAEVEADQGPHKEEEMKDEGGTKGSSYTGKSDNVGVEKSMDGDKTQVLDAGGDKDVGKEVKGDHYKKGHPSDASASVEADMGPHNQASDKGLGEEAISEDDAVNEPHLGHEYKATEVGGDVDKPIDQSIKEESDEDEDDKEEMSEAEGETLKKVTKSSNEQQRPPEEKGDNMPETKKDPHNSSDHSPHTQAGDEMETATKANPKKAVSEEAEELEEKKMKENIKIKTKDGEEVELSGDDEKEAPATKKDDDGEGMDPVGKGDDDIDNDGDTDKSDEYLAKRRDAIDKSDGKDDPNVGKEVKEEFFLEDFSEEELSELTEEELNELKLGRPLPKRGKGDFMKRTDSKAVSMKMGGIKNAKKPTKGVREEDDMDDEDVLDEEFKEKAAIIFETAVNEKANMIREELEAEYESKLNEEMEAVNDRINEYVDYAVQEWIKENQLEIKYSLRTEVAENFIRGLKGLFEDSYIEIPEDDISVVDELTEAVESYKEQLDEKDTALEEANRELLEMKRNEIVDVISEDMTQTQKIRLEKLSESVEADDIEEFRYKVEQLKESYFDGESEQLHESFDDGVFGDVEVDDLSESSISQYAKFLSKTAQF